MSQNPIEALGEQIRTLRAALGHMLIYVNAGVTCCRACGYFIGERTPEEAHAPECIALWLLRTPLPSPESLATLARHAEIGEMVEAFEPGSSIELRHVAGWRAWTRKNSCPPFATPLEALRWANEPAALTPAPKEPTL